jgi:hypothetical protein
MPPDRNTESDARDRLVERYQKCAMAIWELFARDPLGDSPAQAWIERLEEIVKRGLLVPKVVTTAKDVVKHAVKQTKVGDLLVKYTPFSAHFDGMSWPTIGKKAIALQWRFRYAHIETIDRSELLLAASIITAYRELVLKSGEDRAAIVRVLRAVDDRRDEEEWHPSFE